eukprot:TRINITY_DN8693_c0_g2_i1.p1 TRINITY_DN8693_c0_g2~~TRINITY_DN8693_c0_g2_i1.p1  ORF type:complete len:288 (-),score=99.50 TRINITY_DN8693_c0_g2_i1:45-908(-)
MAYRKMITDAIDESLEYPRDRYSYHHISSFIGENYNVNDNYERYVKQALKKGIKDGWLKMEKKSYKFTPKERKRIKDLRANSKRKKTKKRKKTIKKLAKSREDNLNKLRYDSSPKKRRTRNSLKAKYVDEEEDEEEEEEEEIIETRKTTRKKKKSAPKTNKNIKKTTKSKGKKKATITTNKKNGRNSRSTEIAGEIFEISEEIHSLAKEAAKRYKWQYYDNGYHNYDDEASILVEEGYQMYQRRPEKYFVRSVKSGDWEYYVDFANMKQRNIEHSSHTERNIKRVPC